MAEWLWDAMKAAYVRVDGRLTLSQAAVIDLRREFVGELKAQVSGLADQLAAGTLPVLEWEAAMARLIEAGFLAQSLLGRGGVNAATAADVERWQSQLAAQREFLTAWGRELAAPGALAQQTAAGIAARGNLYLASGNATFEAARVAALGLPDLPAYPADGSQECLSNCQCSWQIEQTDDGWDCTWQLEAGARHCETCEANAASWSPLFVPREDAAPAAPAAEGLPAGALAAPVNGKH